MNSGLVGVAGRDVPREQLRVVACRVERWQPVEQRPQVPVRFDPIRLGCLDQAVERHGGVCPARASGEQPILLAHRQWPDGVLRG